MQTRRFCELRDDKEMAVCNRLKDWSTERYEEVG
jgi:activator of HSP90 ATPase